MVLELEHPPLLCRIKASYESLLVPLINHEYMQIIPILVNLQQQQKQKECEIILKTSKNEFGTN